MTRRVPALAGVALLLVTSISGAQERTAPDPTWQISHMRGGVYRVHAGAQVTVFFVTGGGIVLVDPLNPRVSTWLKQELSDRFPGEPVRYVVYTHHHFDRASGGGVFAETAEHVAHDSFFQERAGAAERLPATLAALDRNNDRRLGQDEASGSTFEAPLAIYDRNEDGHVTLAELYSHVRSPERTYHTRRVLTVNGKSVALIHAPNSHAADMTAVYFPEERLLFSADLVPIGGLPTAVGPDLRTTIQSVRRLEKLEFDTLLTGAGQVGTVADLGVFRDYLSELAAGVRGVFNAGLDLDAAKRLVTLDKFSKLSGFSTQRERHIVEVYERMQPVLTGLYGSAQLMLQKVQLVPCETYYESCRSSSEFPWLGATLGVNVSLDRLTIGGEISSAQARTTRLVATDSFFAPYQVVFQHRDMAASFLAGYRLGRADGTVVAVQGGLSVISTRTRTTNVYTEGAFSYGTLTRTEVAPVLGATVVTPRTGRYSVIVPVRLVLGTRNGTELDAPTVTVGAGLMFNVSRSSRSR